jgi:phage tail-like protein
METGVRVDPLMTRTFSVVVQEKELAYFSEVSGLEAHMEVFQYEEGGENRFIHQLPGRLKFANISLKQGIAHNEDLWLWFKDVMNGNVQRKDVSIVLYDSRQNEKRRWNLIKAFPTKWVGPIFKADDNAVSIETLELVFRTMDVTSKR